MQKVFLVTISNPKIFKKRATFTVVELVNGLPDNKTHITGDFAVQSNPGIDSVVVRSLVENKQLPEDKMGGTYIDYSKQDFNLIIVEGKEVFNPLVRLSPLVPVYLVGYQPAEGENRVEVYNDPLEAATSYVDYVFHSKPGSVVFSGALDIKNNMQPLDILLYAQKYLNENGWSKAPLHNKKLAPRKPGT